MRPADDAPGSASFDANPPVAVAQYDASIRQFTASYEPLFEMTHACLRSSLAEDARLLIVGAGTGMEMCTFGRKSPGWHMTGVDPSGDMLSIARSKTGDEGIADRVTLFQGYVQDLPAGRRYDGATCILVMHFLPDDGSKQRLLESISQRLKPGSPLVLVDGFGARDSEPFNRTLSAWKAFVKAQGVDPKVVEDSFKGILKRLQFVPEERIESLLDEAGFEKPTRFYTGFLYGGWVTIKR